MDGLSAVINFQMVKLYNDVEWNIRNLVRVRDRTGKEGLKELKTMGQGYGASSITTHLGNNLGK